MSYTDRERDEMEPGPVTNVGPLHSEFRKNMWIYLINILKYQSFSHLLEEISVYAIETICSVIQFTHYLHLFDI
jgi:hypothetical protein